jgi:hypothetical protein
MLHPKMRKLFIGADIHKRTHVAVIINCFKLKRPQSKKITAKTTELSS